MVRTKGDATVTKVVGAKAPRKNLGGASSGAAGSSSAYSESPSGKKKVSSGLPYCPQPTPEWQKPVTAFFTIKSPTETDNENKENEDVPENTGDDVKECSPVKGKGKGKAPKKKCSEDEGTSTPPKKSRNNVIESDSDED